RRIPGRVPDLAPDLLQVGVGHRLVRQDEAIGEGLVGRTAELHHDVGEPVWQGRVEQQSGNKVVPFLERMEFRDGYSRKRSIAPKMVWLASSGLRSAPAVAGGGLVGGAASAVFMRRGPPASRARVAAAAVRRSKVRRERACSLPGAGAPAGVC